MVAVSILIFVIAVLICALLIYELARPSNDEGLQVNMDNILQTLQDLQNIAFATSGGNRAAGTQGYRDSVNFVVNKLNMTNYYDVSLQEFEVPIWSLTDIPIIQEIAPYNRSFVNQVEFVCLMYSGSGRLQKSVVPVANYGCSDSDYDNFLGGQIALIARGANCTNFEKATRAVSFNASAILLYNQLLADTFASSISQPFAIPVLNIKYEIGYELSQMNPLATMLIVTNTSTVNASTWNIIADTREGNENSTIVIGAHLDSVPAGPGINDNGSGAMIILELALQLASLKTTLANRIRFAWWAAEEIGLLGSSYYVSNLMENETAFDQLALNLNFDMEGSPNYYRGIYNGANAVDPSIRNASGYIQNLFEDYFTNNNLTYGFKDFNGRSDYGPFIDNGVPAGGLSTGAEVIKDEDGRDKFGGMANTPYDPCYHKLCDTVGNINANGLTNMANAAADVLYNIATDFDLSEKLGQSNRSSRKFSRGKWEQ